MPDLIGFRLLNTQVDYNTVRKKQQESKKSCLRQLPSSLYFYNANTMPPSEAYTVATPAVSVKPTFLKGASFRSSSLTSFALSPLLQWATTGIRFSGSGTDFTAIEHMRLNALLIPLAWSS